MQAGSVTLGSSATASHMYLRNPAANSVKAQGRGGNTHRQCCNSVLSVANSKPKPDPNSNPNHNPYPTPQTDTNFEKPFRLRHGNIA